MITTKFLKPFLAAFILATATIWSLLEAYTYFKGDHLKEFLGPYWILVYVIPVLIALVVAPKKPSKSKRSDTVRIVQGNKISTFGDYTFGEVIGQIESSRKEAHATFLKTDFAPEIVLPQGNSNEIYEPYRVHLGGRHKILREQYLELNLREMANFYGLRLVSKLESYENGEQEFPNALLESLAKFFFVNLKFLEEGKPRIFRNVEIYSDECEYLIANKFRPYFLCCRETPRGSLTYPVLHKIEDGYGRTIVADLDASFYSSGGGRANIEKIIALMVRNGLNFTEASVLSIDLTTWNALENNTFYSKDMHLDLRIGRADFECQRIYQQWFAEIKSTISKVVIY